MTACEDTPCAPPALACTHTAPSDRIKIWHMRDRAYCWLFIFTLWIISYHSSMSMAQGGGYHGWIIGKLMIPYNTFHVGMCMVCDQACPLFWLCILFLFVFISIVQGGGYNEKLIRHHYISHITCSWYPCMGLSKLRTSSFFTACIHFHAANAFE